MINEINPDQGPSVSGLQWWCGGLQSCTKHHPEQILPAWGDKLVTTDIEPSMIDVYICENVVIIGKGGSEPLMTRPAPVNVEIRQETESVLVTIHHRSEAHYQPHHLVLQNTWLHSSLSGGENLITGLVTVLV